MTPEQRPTCQLVLEAAGHLSAVSPDLRLRAVVASVQRIAPDRDRGSIQPVVQA